MLNALLGKQNPAYIRRMKKVGLLLILLLCPLLTLAQGFSKPYQAFIDACTGAFAQSSSGDGEKPTPEHIAFGKSLCECTATESKSQKVPLSHLEKETAKIRADSKYKLHDPGLLASLQYCSMKSTEALDPDQK
jgi:hypothetical protein